MQELIQKATEILAMSRSITVVTGAGISAESGIATYRDADGLWKGLRVDFDGRRLLAKSEGSDGYAQDERGDGGKEGFGGFHCIQFRAAEFVRLCLRKTHALACRSKERSLSYVPHEF